jgi:NAD-dependent deacetylase
MIVVLTGAGISKESGFATFRDADGLWEQERVEDVATPEGFARDPAKVLGFYNRLRKGLANARPNPAHVALARLEASLPGKVLVVTQNVDDLHERGGTENLIHMHGELLKMRCRTCRKVMDIHADMGREDVCPACGAFGTLRPHIVWFGEMPLEMETIEEALLRCSLFVSIGTSGTVYPAAGFSRLAKASGAVTVELNLESTAPDVFAFGSYGPAGTVVPAWVDDLLSNRLPYRL